MLWKIPKPLITILSAFLRGAFEQCPRGKKVVVKSAESSWPVQSKHEMRGIRGKRRAPKVDDLLNRNSQQQTQTNPVAPVLFLRERASDAPVF